MRSAAIIVALLLAIATASVAAGPDEAIAIREVIPFAGDLTDTTGSGLSDASTEGSVKAKCDLGRTLSERIVSGAGSKGVRLVRTAQIEQAEGKVLHVEIDGVQGRLGGAMTGTKVMVVRGELRDGDTVIGSFIARRQQTALASGTCKAFTNCVKTIAKDIAKWLKNPVMKARLGTA